MRKFEGLKMSEVRRHSLWKKGRLFACSAISTSLVAIMAVIQGLACIDNVPTAVLRLLVTTAGIARIFFPDRSRVSIDCEEKFSVYSLW